MGFVCHKVVSGAEADYYAELDGNDDFESEVIRQKDAYISRFDGSRQAARGDYEGAILAAEEFNSGRIS